MEAPVVLLLLLLVLAAGAAAPLVIQHSSNAASSTLVATSSGGAGHTVTSSAPPAATSSTATSSTTSTPPAKLPVWSSRDVCGVEDAPPGQPMYGYACIHVEWTSMITLGGEAVVRVLVTGVSSASGPGSIVVYERFPETWRIVANETVQLRPGEAEAIAFTPRAWSQTLIHEYVVTLHAHDPWRKLAETTITVQEVGP